LPDLRDRTVVGTGNGVSIGSQPGANFPTVTAAQLPTAFASPTFPLSAVGPSAGWSSDDTYPRKVADVSGDGIADIVGFSSAGGIESLATAGRLSAALTSEPSALGVVGGGASSDSADPRKLTNADGGRGGIADIVGFGAAGVHESLATGGGNFAA